MTSGTWRRGHWARGEGGYNPAEHGPAEQLLPGPGDDIDLGDIDLGDGDGGLSPAEMEFIARHGGAAAHAAANGRTADLPSSAGPKREAPRADLDEEEIPADPAPGPVNAPPGRGGGKRAAAAVRVTVNVRKDIAAKVHLCLLIPGQVWAARDPLCGGMFVQQVPDTTDALVDIICDSPDLVAFFTGPGGNFMKFLKLAIALQPVGTVMYAHHIVHAIADQDEAAPGVDARQYAA